MAKNKMRRCFTAILDPHPSKSEVDELWDYFESACVYCGAAIERASRTGHLDHVCPTSDGGTNSIFNHVLSCARCNGDEKREESWRTFLQRKSANPDLASARGKKIEEWLSRQPSSTILDAQRREEADGIIAEALENFDSAVEALRRIRRSSA